MDWQEKQAQEAKAQKTPVLFVETQDERSAFGEYCRAFVRLVWLSPDDNKPRNYTGNACDQLAFYPEGLTVYAQSNTKWDNAGELYAWCVEYRDTFTIRLEIAEEMVKALRMVARKMQRLDDKYGPAKTFGQYVARFADAVGATSAVRQDGGNGHCYSENYYQVGTVKDAVYWLDWQEHTWKEKYRKNAPTP